MTDQVTTNTAADQPMIDRRLLIKTDDLLAFNRYGQNGGALGRRLQDAGAVYIGDVLHREFPETVNGAAKGRLVDMLANIGLPFEATMSAEAWAAIDPASQPPVGMDEIYDTRRAEIQR